jgi:flagellin
MQKPTPVDAKIGQAPLRRTAAAASTRKVQKMANSVTLTASVRANLLALQNTAQLLSQTQSRLATGKKVNSALDNPVEFFTASALTARSSELSALLDQMTNGVNTIQAANNGLTSITNIIQSMQATVTQARQDSSWQSQSFSFNTSAFSNAGGLKTLTFSGGAVSGSVSVNLNDNETLTGAGGFTGPNNAQGVATAGTAGSFTIQAADINGGQPVTVNVNATDTEANVIRAINTAVGIPGFAVDNAGQINLVDTAGNPITVGTSAAATAVGFAAGNLTSTATAGPVETTDGIVAAINSNANLSGLVKATNDNGKLQITNLSTSPLTVTGVAGTTIDGSTATATIGGNTVRSNLVTTFNQLRDQLDKTATDSSFNGNNLLTGDALKLVFNETATSTLTIQSTAATGINSTQLGIGNGTIQQFQDNTLLDGLSNTLNNALNTVASQAASFGANLSIVQNRQDFTNAMINTLTTGADSLTLADTNQEGANILALQTRQQLSTTALSLANQANQAVLRLFG